MRKSLITLALAMIAGCSGTKEADGRAITGVAPEGTARIYAIDADGVSAVADAASGEFRIAIASHQPVVLFLQRDDGVVAPLVFETGVGTETSSTIPDFAGEVALGQVSYVDATTQRDGEGEVTAESEENPLDEVDSDDDGDSDYADADDDDDGTDDADDDDRDGNGHDDHDEDQDNDDDGSPDESDDDDDNDGIDDGDDADDDGDGEDDGDDGDDGGDDTDESETESE